MSANEAVYFFDKVGGGLEGAIAVELNARRILPPASGGRAAEVARILRRSTRVASGAIEGASLPAG